MTKEFVNFLNEVGKHVQPQKERTIFSLGGRGYYENPASDLLGFFLKPDAEHGFDALFLEAFLECMKVDFTKLGMAGVTVSREDKTADGNRTDIVVQGLDWVLLIENKIYHIQENPFVSYEAFGRDLASGRNLLLSILSPHGESDPERWKSENWKHVSYQNYCDALRRRLGEILFDHAYSKWVVFAREFILHFENELYQPSMKYEDADFYEQHWQQINQATKLESEYGNFLSELLKDSLTKAVPGHCFKTKIETWGVRCYAEKWGLSHVVLLTDFRSSDKPFKVRVYLDQATSKQNEHGRKVFHEMECCPDGAKCLMLDTKSGFDKRTDAVNDLCRHATLLSELLRSPDEPLRLVSPSLTPP